jgi:hypothetical protein
MSFQYTQPQPEEEVEKKPPVNRGVIIAIAIGLVFVICVIIGLVFVLPQISSLSASAPSAEPVSYDIPTAREAYISAVGLIRQQDPGAELASATGAWTPVIDKALLDNGRTGWTFAFYLPATNQMALVVVDRVASPRIASVEPWGSPPALLDDQNWQIDSGTSGMKAFVHTCEGVLDTQAGSQARATLSMAEENEILLWQYEVLSSDGIALCRVSVDASSGQIRQ